MLHAITDFKAITEQNILGVSPSDVYRESQFNEDISEDISFQASWIMIYVVWLVVILFTEIKLIVE